MMLGRPFCIQMKTFAIQASGLLLKHLWGLPALTKAISDAAAPVRRVAHRALIVLSPLVPTRAGIGGRSAQPRAQFPNGRRDAAPDPQERIPPGV